MLADEGERVFWEDFEDSDSQWEIDNGIWEIGEPTSGPSSSYEGSSVAATNLSGNYSDNDTDSRLISPSIDLPGAGADEEILLRFWQWYAYEYRDRGHVQISVWDGSAWGDWTTLLESAQEYANSGWSRVGVDLTAYEGQRVRIAFYHLEHSSSASSGWYIDGVEIWHGVPSFAPVEGFESGWDDWYTDHGVWQIGEPSSGPSGAYEGSSVAGTILSGNYPSYDTDSRLISPSFYLPGAGADEEILLRFWQWYDYAYRDRGDVQISIWDGSSWGDWTTLLNSAQEDGSSDWSRMAVDLTAYAGQRVRIAFFHVESSSVSSGWYIDQVRIITCYRRRENAINVAI